MDTRLTAWASPRITELALLLLLLPSALFAQAPQSDLTAALALEKAFVRAIEKSERSVVSIARGRRGTDRELTDPQFIPHEYSAGVVVDPSGLILTNYHTLGKVEENDFAVWMKGKAYIAKVKAADPWTDLAILEIKAKNLVPIEFGDATNLKKGRIVISLGNPHAIARDGNVSATWGIVSNIHRKVDGPLRGEAGPDIVRRRETLYHFGGLIQTDAKLAKNTSGGPLLNLDGKMVGLSTTIALLAGFEKGTGYAVPVNDRFRRVVEKLKQGEEVESGFLGVAPRNPNPLNGEVGIILKSVEPGTPAAKGSLVIMDEIVSIDDKPVRTIDDLFFIVGSQPPGHVAKVSVREPGLPFLGSKETTLKVALAKKPNATTRPVIATKPRPRWRGIEVDYSTALSLKKISALDPEGCVIVTAVERDSSPWRAGLRVGTVISRVNEEKVQTPDEFYASVENLPGDVRFTLFDPQNGHDDVAIAGNSTAIEQNDAAVQP